MVPDRNKMSALMRQYLATKDEYEDCILMCRVGDFYEMFFEDAKTASRELDLVLTGKDCGLEERAPMCGVPYHASESYISRLVGKGYKVAICEQTEDPKEAKGLVKREVIRVITPGTTTDESLLDSRPTNYMCTISKNENDSALCLADVSTGEILVTFLKDDKGNVNLISELNRFLPVEIILNMGAISDKGLYEYIKDKIGALCFSCDESYFEYRNSLLAIQTQFGKESDKVSENPLLTGALGALTSYLWETQKTEITHMKEITFFEASRFMEIGSSAQRNLELVENMRDGGKKGTLFNVLDKTCTLVGRRTLKSWILRPLTDVFKIKMRHNAVGEAAEKLILRTEIRELMDGMNDIERIVSRVSLGTVNPRDLVALKNTLKRLPSLKSKCSQFKSELLSSQNEEINTLEKLTDLIDRAIIDKDTPVTVREGKIIKEGFSEQIDYLNRLIKGSQEILREIETRERERTGISKLKVSYNKVFGYYIEVSNVNLSKVPPEYIRKQTLTNGERFITEELKEVEKDVLSAGEKVVRLEYEAFLKVVSAVSDNIAEIQKTSKAIGVIDVICSLAKVAVDNSYTMPEIDNSDIIEIKDGRHPVVELLLKDELFVPNDTFLFGKKDSTAIITGPNMAGKSTYMRQVALIALMAQMGSFVPAKSCKMGIVDKIFTRVGAFDDLSTGRSTYMVEMSEVAEIIDKATEKSLIILDEIGRGTSTYDGLSMARAVVEYCCETIKARTLFATHYHELTELEDSLDGAKNYCVAVKKRGDDIVFLRKIIRGGADESYGIEVAHLAGIKESVIKRAKEILNQIEKGEREDSSPKTEALWQINVCDEANNEILKRLKMMDITTISPLEALNLLNELKSKAEEIRKED